MSDEKPLKLIPKKRKLKPVKADLECIIHCRPVQQKITPMNDSSFDKIQSVRYIREQNKSEGDFEHVLTNIPDTYSKQRHGYHRACYQKFTNVSKILKRRVHTADGDEPKSKRKRMSDPNNILFPKDQCLFCAKNRKKVKGREQSLVTCVTDTASETIKNIALEKQDYEMQAKVNNSDLVAREAVYHPTCYKIYTHSDERNKTQSKNDEQSKLEQEAHAASFAYLAQYIEDSIITKCNVERLSMLKEKYLLYLQEHFPKHYNPNYKTYKLKQKIQRQFGNKVHFWQPNYHSELVYSSNVKSGHAIETAFEAAASETRRLEEAALMLRRMILTAEKTTPQKPWPVPNGYQLKDWDHPPDELTTYLSNLITGKKAGDVSEDQQRILLSIGRDILYAVTHGRWMTSKHILLGMSLWHITGRADVIQLVNRFGHCVSYSRLLEVLTSIQLSIRDHNSPIPPGIQSVGNDVIHFCWDNFDLNEETISGAGTTHSTHGLVIQEVNRNARVSGTMADQVLPKTKQRSVICDDVVLEPCFVRPHVPPNLNVVISTPPNHPELVSEIRASDGLWILCRISATKHNRPQVVPSWAGWVSLTGERRQEQETIVEYMPPVNSPITENATVMHVLKVSQEATAAVDQAYTIVTFDLAAAKKAYSIIWSYPMQFKNVIVRLGAFHMACAYIGALGKLMKGSGYEEVLIESAVCASGSIDQVMSGKHYNRARHVIKCSVEALERLLWDCFVEEQQLVIDENTLHLLEQLVREPNKVNLYTLKDDEHLQQIFTKYEDYKNQIRNGSLGKTSQFWMAFLDKAWTLLHFLRATKQNNFDLHVACLNKMCPLFFSQDRPNYARYTAYYLMMLLNLPHSHPGALALLKNKGLSVNRSSVPSSRNAVDITIEQTYNRHASGHGPGIIGFSRNVAAYHRWSTTRHARAEYLEATLEMAGLGDEENTRHKDLNKSEINKGEMSVQRLVKAFQNFINPFKVSNRDELYCISSGKPVPQNIAIDLLSVDKHGTSAFLAFVQDRLVGKSVSFHAPIKRLGLKNFSSMALSKPITSTTKKNKELVAERNLFGQLILIAMQNQLSLEKVLSYPLGPVPWSLATADGTPTKTNKATLLPTLEKGHVIINKPDHTIHCIDGNTMLYELTNIPDTFGELAEAVFNRLPKGKRVDFVTDSYKENSIKNPERNRRGSAQNFLIQGPLTKVPRNYKDFLKCDKNKSQVIHLILNEWKSNKYANKLINRQVLHVDGEHCWRLTSSDGETTECSEVPGLCSTQEEADTRIILHLLHMSTHAMDASSIIVRSSDTDVLLLLIKYASQVTLPVILDTGTADRRRMVDINSIVHDRGELWCDAILAFHAYTGCDTTSAFVRKGKLTPLKKLEKNERYMRCFASLGTSTHVTDAQLSDLEAFTCLLYGSKNTAFDIDKLRYTIYSTRYTPNGQLLSNEKGIDLSLLPPCRSSLQMHIRRVNYQCLIWNRANVAKPELPSPDDGHGWITADGGLDFKWTEGNMLPCELIDLVVDVQLHVQAEEDEEYYNVQDDIYEGVDEMNTEELEEVLT